MNNNIRDCNYPIPFPFDPQQVGTFPLEKPLVEGNTWTILLIDDDEEDYLITRSLFSDIKRYRTRLTWLSSYDEAVEAASANRYDAILVDYDLGTHNGLELTRRLIENGIEAPVILLTGIGSYEVDFQAVKAGASDYLSKGDVTPLLLERSIRYAIERKQAETALLRLNENLETRVQERTRELLHKHEALEAEMRERRRIEDELAEVRRRLLDRVDIERLELARDLHDGPMQDLYSISYEISAAAISLPEPAQETISEIQNRIQEVIRNLRAMAGELRPPSLAPFGLEKAIRAHAEQFQKRHNGIDIDLRLQPDELRLPEKTRLALFRVYQVGLTNIVRHARASKASIHLNVQPDRVTLEIIDNGCGFTRPDSWYEFARAGHLGLAGAAERVQALGGLLTVDSSPGNGTRLTVTAPYQTTTEE